MDSIVRTSLKGQYHGTLAMLRECVEVCPNDLWTAGEHPRNFWRIAYHAAFYAHLYLMQSEQDFVPWEKHRDVAAELFLDEAPHPVEPYAQAEVMDYIDHVDALIDPVIDALDWQTQETGFHWYTSLGKLEHEILSIRHLGIHVGQLEELLDQRGIDFNWITRH